MQGAFVLIAFFLFDYEIVHAVWSYYNDIQKGLEHDL